ncbi:kinase-like domain-containing protein [Mycena capillaripes]|nr:kinase-like domain-containing protein [Mycena capillaripes]
MSLPPFPSSNVNPQEDHEVDHHLWAYLIPLGKNPQILRVDFWRISATAKLGRDPARNTLILPGPHISATHAEIFWNGKNGRSSVITLKDLSSGGTWVSGELVGRDKVRRLKSGDEIGFGAPVAVNDHGGLYDYRYQFFDVSVKQPSSRLDNLYKFGRHLGIGAGGSVRLATEKGTKSVVAIKTVQYLETKMDVFAEICAMESVTHEHITRIFAAHHAETQPVIYLVLEYMQGGDLMQYMQREHKARNLWPDGPASRGIPENICREIMYQLCHAMAHLHLNGITHRDLKPENILLRDGPSKDSTPFIKVCDFGLANIQRLDRDDNDIMKSLCGTVLYAAPEVLNPAQPGYNYLADSFSAGVMLFYMIILHDPWCEPRDLPGYPLPEMNWDYLSTQLLSPAGYDLLDRLVELDPEKRVSLAGALNHTWMKAHKPMHHKLTGPYMEA